MQITIQKTAIKHQKQHHFSKLWVQQTLRWGIALAFVGWSSLPAWSQTLSQKVLAMEGGLEKEFEDYFGENLADVTQTPEKIAQTLQQIGQATNTKPAVLWVIPREDHLHLVLLTPGGTPIVRDLHDVPTTKLRSVVEAFHLEMHSSPSKVKMTAAQQLYQWIIQPYEADYLQAEKIDTILFCLGKGVRSLPLAALYDGKQFLIEKYSLTRIPAFNLIQTDYVQMKPGQILAMGASEFRDQSPLPAVPTELATILKELQSDRPPQAQWQGRSFLNQGFTLANLQQWVKTQPPQIVHLATHAVFKPGKPANSYIQLWDSKLALDTIRQVNWGSPALELLVLSACRTAIGDDQAELGFAGVALKSKVKTVMASLWNVSDEGTLALMSEFYRQLGTTSTKAAALRQAQLKMLHGDTRIEGKKLILSRGSVTLPAELKNVTSDDLSAPYYWAAFTLISSPW
ncbi:CHAT domain-containing protein [Pantanalinema sp. GBBB05]|uniref:CHAT domain-containing protein n=1 Tax=Pantanalinema sp. GBBB05 TaxID=2604139 RepID=UPI001D80182B|nr:CHAT domain-containing protein [Pantanalinema sp. GBBB05]